MPGKSIKIACCCCIGLAVLIVINGSAAVSVRREEMHGHSQAAPIDTADTEHSDRSGNSEGSTNAVPSEITEEMPRTKAMTVVIACDCEDYNHVGNEWVMAFRINQTEVATGCTVEVSLNESITLETQIIEKDEKYPDESMKQTTMIISQNQFGEAFTVEQRINVTEFNGAYKGCTAMWTVTYAFIPTD